MEAYMEGQQIKHAIYGLGRVMEADEDRTTVEFDGHGVKKFVTSMMSAEVVGMAPKRKRGRPRKKPLVAPDAPVALAAAAVAPKNGKSSKR